MPFRKIIRSPEAGLPPPVTDLPPRAGSEKPAGAQPVADAQGDSTTGGPGGGAEPAPAADREYAVGYGKPPLHSRFKKGKSGNPKGRPGGAKGLNKMIRKTLLVRVPMRTERGVSRVTRIEAIIHKQLEQAVKGNQRAAIQLMTLYAAAVPDQAEQTSDGGPSLTATDETILARFRAQILADEGDDL